MNANSLQFDIFIDYYMQIVHNNPKWLYNRIKLIQIGSIVESNLKFEYFVQVLNSNFL